MFSRALCIVTVVSALTIAACSRTRGTVKAGVDGGVHIAEQFGLALAKGDFAGAHGFLTGHARRTYSPDDLKQEVAQMTSYAPGPIEQVEIMQSLDAWPDRKSGDIAWVYVALTGDSFSEAVSLVLCSTPAGTRVREIEWGRP